MADGRADLLGEVAGRALGSGPVWAARWAPRCVATGKYSGPASRTPRPDLTGPIPLGSGKGKVAGRVAREFRVA
jgi:hypothetical protein